MFRENTEELKQITRKNYNRMGDKQTFENKNQSKSVAPVCTEGFLCPFFSSPQRKTGLRLETNMGVIAATCRFIKETERVNKAKPVLREVRWPDTSPPWKDARGGMAYKNRYGLDASV